MDKIVLHNEEFTYNTKCIAQTIILFKLEKRCRGSTTLSIQMYTFKKQNQK